LSSAESLGVARTDGLAEGGQQSAVDIDRHEANGGMHKSSLRGGDGAPSF
jgi:hypothetical protein